MSIELTDALVFLSARRETLCRLSMIDDKALCRLAIIDFIDTALCRLGIIDLADDFRTLLLCKILSTLALVFLFFPLLGM
jgi:hypothetical protein